MKNFNSKHALYLAEAEAMYFSANGGDSEYFAAEGDYPEAFAFNTGEEQLAPSQYAAEGEATAATPALQIPDFNRTYTVTFVETSGANVQGLLFGANQFANAINFGNPATSVPTLGEATYQELMYETMTSPFVISGFRVAASGANSATQLEQVLSITKRDANGQLCTYPLQIGSYFTAYQFQPNIRDIYPYNITVTGQTRITFTLLANTTVVFTFFVGKRMGYDNLLHGKPQTELALQPVPFLAKQRLELTQRSVEALKG